MARWRCAALVGPGRRGAGSGEISYWHHFTSETEQAGMERVLEQFTAANAGVTRDPENIPNADYMAKFTSAALAGSLPDTAMVAVDRLPDMWGMEGVQPLTDWINAWELKDAFPESVWTGATIEGEIYGLPAFMFVDWLYYRKDWFEEAGIAGPPTTFEEFIDAAIKLTDPAKGRFGFGMRGGDGGEGMVIQMMQAFGSPIADESGCAALDVAKAAEALKAYTDLFTVHKASPPSTPGDSLPADHGGLQDGPDRHDLAPHRLPDRDRRRSRRERHDRGRGRRAPPGSSAPSRRSSTACRSTTMPTRPGPG